MNIAGSVGTILASSMMLQWLGGNGRNGYLPKTSHRTKSDVLAKTRRRQSDTGGRATTDEVIEAMIGALLSALMP